MIYKKYALIALGAVAVIILYVVITQVIKKVSHPTPDLSVVVACGKVVDFQMEDEMEAYLKPMVGDLDGNGKAVADVVPLTLRENEAVMQAGVGEMGADQLRAYITDGTYKLYLLSDEERPGVFQAAKAYCSENYCRALPEDLAAEDNPYCTEMTGCELLTKQSWVIPVLRLYPEGRHPGGIRYCGGDPETAQGCLEKAAPFAKGADGVFSGLLDEIFRQVGQEIRIVPLFRGTRTRVLKAGHLK